VENSDAKADHNNKSDCGDGVSGFRFCRDGAEREENAGIVDAFFNYVRDRP